MFKEVIIVEGRDDTRRLKEIYPQIKTLETNGSAINEETLSQISRLQASCGVIVFTDPDFPGQKIRQAISDAVPGCKHAYIGKSDAIARNNRGLGVEHASTEAIKAALGRIMTPSTTDVPVIEASILMDMGLIGHHRSAQLRSVLADKLGIGHVNGKQLQKRLQLFGITLEKIKEALSDA